jgi:opacity protein-like surface antigen
MKSWIFVLVLLVALGASVPALADSSSLYLAYQYGDDADHAVGPMFSYTLDLDPAVRTSARIGFLQFTDPDLDMIPLEVTGAINFGDEEMVPYLGLGIGYYLLDADRGEMDDDVGFKLFAGVDWPATEGLDWFAEISWLWLEGDVDQAFALTEGTGRTVDLGGIGANLGLRYRF